MKKDLLIGFSAFGLLVFACSLTIHFFGVKNNLTRSTVMITNTHRNSGGSGVIFRSTEHNTSVVTNSHVCEVVKNGGIVRTVGGEEHFVSTYKQSAFHDMCLINVEADLKVNTKLAATKPEVYDTALVSGHPSLYPNVITKGHVSGTKFLNVMTGFRDCNEEDNNDEISRNICALFGKFPLIKKYETVLVTSTIMPGSSGSGVYNENNELEGLVFAGTEGLSYAFTVPYDYVANFLNIESLTMEASKPSSVMTIKELTNSGRAPTSINIERLCNQTTDSEIVRLCAIITRDLKFNEGLK